ncbi:acetyltransferase [Niabella ginsenosidivorans]|uniref:Acetyltransferase n=1 Tax=Niabella ginsenosidivorans TaxID=1176587 RepID=A0A1A9I8B6_9BACT|nr:GNAT family N-acetyltransferase [Niabella ginsenosidivorans]ANH82784.1 acetyltransferase [Niabella ginsenosidivorans]
MKPEYTEIPLIKNDALQQFEITIDGYKAFIKFHETPGHFTLIHTEAAPELEGKGAGTAVVEKTLEYIAQSNKTLIPLCPFIFAYIKRHPEWKKQVAPEFKGFND